MEASSVGVIVTEITYGIDTLKKKLYALVVKVVGRKCTGFSGFFVTLALGECVCVSHNFWFPTQ